MFRSTALALIASAALLALAGCNTEGLDVTEAMQPIADAMDTPPLGHELHRMFEAEKHNASFSELPAQF
jgi:hypothetical protein